jgi:hypothetical protein
MRLQSGQPKFIAFSFLALLSSVFAALILAEGFLRLHGFQPAAGEPVIHEPDQILGWRNKPGEYRFLFRVESKRSGII